MNRIEPAKRFVLGAVLVAAFCASPHGAYGGTWTTGVIDSDGDVGRYCEIALDDAGNAHVVYRHQGLGIIKIASRVGDVWQPPDTVDGRSIGGSYCALVAGPAGARRVSYQRGDITALAYAGPESVNTWEIAPITASADDIGSYLSTRRRADGEMSASCRNATAGSLLLLERDEFGAWTAPQTVDPGPNRGTYSDHVYRPGAGYAFSEYDGARTLLLFADPVLHANEWAIGVIREKHNSGAYVSAVLAPDNRVASAFYQFDEMAEGRILISALNSYGYAVVQAVEDTVGNDAGDDVYIDLALTPGWDWHISYRNALDGHLWYAFTGAHVITAVEEDEKDDPVPSALRLEQNYPNPFNPTTVIRYAVPSPGPVTLRVYDAAGRLVRTLVDEAKLAGNHTVTWNARDNAGRSVVSGMYFLRLSQGGTLSARKIVVLR